MPATRCSHESHELHELTTNDSCSHSCHSWNSWLGLVASSQLRPSSQIREQCRIQGLRGLQRFEIYPIARCSLTERIDVGVNLPKILVAQHVGHHVQLLF